MQNEAATAQRREAEEAQRLKALKTFELRQEGRLPFDIMAELGLNDEELFLYVQRFNQIKAESEKSGATDTEKYAAAYYKMVQYLGEPVRDGCQWFDSVNAQ